MTTIAQVGFDGKEIFKHDPMLMTPAPAIRGALSRASFGSSVQHIAFGCDDIFATAAALTARGFPFLRIGANYNDVVEALFACPAVSGSKISS
ncbi:MAG: hypothetical protein U1D35_07130 [Paracoccaceae bacterium]|nr:hypothetical protein [Paracoccaceae bacterium]